MTMALPFRQKAMVKRHQAYRKVKDLVKTECSAPRHLIFLELGIIPARYVIKQKQIIHLKHILKQNKSKLMKKVFNS